MPNILKKLEQKIRSYYPVNRKKFDTEISQIKSLLQGIYTEQIFAQNPSRIFSLNYLFAKMLGGRDLLMSATSAFICQTLTPTSSKTPSLWVLIFSASTRSKPPTSS